MRVRLGLVTTAVVLGGLVMAGCSTGAGTQDDLQAAPTLVAAMPAISPRPAVTPAGSVIGLPGPATAVVADPAGGVVAVAVSQPAELVLFALADPDAAPRVVPLPGSVTHLATGNGTILAPVASANTVVEVNPRTATSTVVSVPGGPTSAVDVNGHRYVAVPARNAVDVVTGDKITGTITGTVNPDQVLAAGGKLMLLDRVRSAVFDVDPAASTIGAGQRAGAGATNAATDGFGRILVTDTRTGELLAFSPGPVLLRQRTPVPGAPYGIAVDTRREIAWITATQLNQVIGYRLTGGQPVERYRLATVRQPDSVAVDPDSGRVFVASSDSSTDGGGMQVMQP